MKRCFALVCAVMWAAATAPGEAADAPLIPVGAAAIDVTPDHPVRLTGYGNRKTESEGVAGRLFAKALAIGDGGRLAVWITVDNCGVPGAMTERVAEHLKVKFNLRRERLALSSTHTHTGPQLPGFAPLILTEITPEHQRHIDQYARELERKIKQVAEQAIAARKPAPLSWTQGKATFAGNRRTVKEGKYAGFSAAASGGPVDHDLPLLIAGPADHPAALLVNYACHCTTWGGKFNQIHGDWAGVAQQAIERRHPGAVALVAIGCGADANPYPRVDEMKVVEGHGLRIADEVDRLLKGPAIALKGPPDCRMERVDLPFDKLPTREELKKLAEGKPSPAQYHARMDLQRLEKGESPPTRLTGYPVQSWVFGDELAMVFLAGEVVVDYSHRIKKQFDGKRMWVNAYSNDVPSYIASKRILAEGGYEADSSMHYYDRPTRYSPEIEDIILDAVQKVLPRGYFSAELKEAFPPALSAEESLKRISVPAGFKVVLAAGEPLIQDPVAFDWGPDGRLWVIEMSDYPNGMDGRGSPGGRLKVLEDVEGDGVYDKAKLFLEGLSFPTGVKVWRKGVLITAAPQVIYAEDQDGDGRADVKQTLYAGFGEENQQHRVNGLRWGLDGWLYLGSGSGGGGRIQSLKTGQSIDMARRDLRIKPDEGLIDAQSGHTQYGRERDDWGNWFGGNNSNPIWHYIQEDHYLRRNPYLSPGSSYVQISRQPGAAPVYPSSKTLARFNDPDKANRFTSACSPMIYRDNLLGEAFYGNVFVCEPVHNLVHRQVMERKGLTFSARRDDSEEQSEFFRSSDSWCRPSMARMGPDGALWIADMYRFVIEHPKWIPQEWQRKLEVRDGETMGRIYRVIPADRPAGSIPRMDRMDDSRLLEALAATNGHQRDMAQQMLTWRNDARTASPLEEMAAGHRAAQGRLQALCTLDTMNRLRDEILLKAMADEEPEIRKNAVRIAEKRMNKSGPVLDAALKAAEDPDARVRMQAAYSLGESEDPRVGAALGKLIVRDGGEKYLVLAAASSSVKCIGPVLKAAMEGKADQSTLDVLLNTAAGSENKEAIDLWWRRVADSRGSARMTALGRLLEAAELQGRGSKLVYTADHAPLIARIMQEARTTAGSVGATTADRLRSIALLGREPARRTADVKLIGDLLAAQQPLEVQSAAVNQLARLKDKSVSGLLMDRWPAVSPQVKGQILDTMLGRAGWVDELLDRLASNAEMAAALGTTRREQLLRSKSPGIAQRAAKLLGGSGDADRRNLVRDYVRRMESLQGDAAHGQALFTSTCAVCHKVGDNGREIGPDLLALADKPADQLVLAILDPNLAVEGRFVNYIATTRDGLTVMGLIKFESGNTITLVGLNGHDQVIARGDLQSLVSTGRSMMPEGFENALKPQDMADVLGYLREQIKRKPGR